MPRPPRLVIPGLPMHVVQRGNDRRPCFFDDRDRIFYLQAIREKALRYGVQIHAYVLMTNHVHLLLTPRETDSVSRLMQALGACYVWHVNTIRQRTGTLWEGRFRSCVVANDAHLSRACRYIDLNPVRAGMVLHPGQYRWSSYRALAGVCADPLVLPHEAMSRVGIAPGPAYADWCAARGDVADAEQIRDATRHGLPFGTDTFKLSIEPEAGRPLLPRARGRPRKPHDFAVTV